MPKDKKTDDKKLDGKKLAEKILDELKQKTLKLKTKPSLAVILANDSEASKIYVSNKEKKAHALGFNSQIYKFDKSATNDDILNLINKLNNDKNTHAILVQLPLFSHLDEQKLIEAIDPIKDVDGFHPINTGKLMSGLKPYSIPCTPKGIIRLLKEYNVNLEGKNVLITGRSNIVGKPLALLLIKENATVTVAHSKTKNLADIAKTKDIIISATGKKNLITKDMIKQDAVIVDVGIVRDENNKIKGDVDFENAAEIASLITPVPGGVGPMTIAMLMENTYELYLEQAEKI